MNRQEFERWLTLTRKSQYRWQVDLIHNGRNGRDLLVYKGGEDDGLYFNISPTGVVEIGGYQDAFPHIGEALFTPDAQHPCKGYEDALSRLRIVMGDDFPTQDYALGGTQ